MTTGEKLSNELADLVGQAGEASSKAPAAEKGPMSPARKEATGNIRNLKQMGGDKFDLLVEQMRPYELEDPEAYAAVQKEAARRGL